MTRTLEVEVDESGAVRPIQPDTKLPAGRAFLHYPIAEEHSCYVLSEKALEDWLRPEEDEAWSYLQPKQKEEASS